MNRSEAQSALAAHAFLAGLSPSHLATLADCVQRITVTPGQYLGREREPAQAFYLLQSGRVAIELQKADRSVPLQTLGPGDLVGWSWLVSPHYWQFDARVLETVHALALDAGQLRRHCEADHELGYQLLQRLLTVVAGRLAATRRQLLEVQR